MKKIKHRKPSIRKPALSAVGMVILGNLMTHGAHAASFEVDATARSVDIGGHLVLPNVQRQTGPVDAQSRANRAGIFTTGAQPDSSNSVAGNDISAGAVANALGNDIDLSVRGSGPELAGYAALGLQTQTGVTTSNAERNETALVLEGFTSGSAAVTKNDITARSKLNEAISTVGGVLPNRQASAVRAPASVNISPADALIRSEGGIVLGSVQQGLGGSSSATASENEHRLVLEASGDNIVRAAPQLDGNGISAAFVGNRAENTVDLQAGGTPVAEGSIALSNLQENRNPGAAPVSHTATTSDSRIVARVDGARTGDVNTLNGALSVDGNAIASSVAGNEASGAKSAAGNRLLLGDGLSFSGAGGFAGSGSVLAPGAQQLEALGDLIVVNAQRNVGVSLQGSTGESSIGAEVQSLVDGAAKVAGNTIGSSASGNSASSALEGGQGAASIAGTAALANQQINEHGAAPTQIGASTSGSSIGAAVASDGSGRLQDSSVLVEGNRVAASAYGNRIAQDLALAANALESASGTTFLNGGSANAGLVAGVGGATISSLQGNLGVAVSSSNTGSTVGIYAGSPAAGGASGGNTLRVADNRQEATAVGNAAGNELSLDANSADTGAGIANVQINDSGSRITASLQDAAAGLHSAADVEESSLSLTGNLQRAVGYANSAVNSLQLKANGIAVASSSQTGSFIDAGAAQGSLGAAYGLLNLQSSQADVEATAAATDSGRSGFALAVEGRVLNSSLRNDANNFAAAAYGNDAANQVKLSLGNAQAADAGAIASVGNAQATNGSIAASAAAADLLSTRIDGALTGSTVSTSGNSIEALALGSSATNALAASANTIENTGNLPGRVSGARIEGGQAIAEASFVVQNVQTGAGSVTATQVGPGAQPTASGISTRVSGATSGSTVRSDKNVSLASATSNKADNSLALKANALAGSSALQNSQSSSADVRARVGLAEIAGTPAQGGVRLALGGDVDSSTLSVNGNRNSGTATGNSASNGSSVSANTLDGDSGRGVSYAGMRDGVHGAWADHALVNSQTVSGGATIDSDVHGTFGIETAEDARVSGSSLSVADNRQSAIAVANTAESQLALAGNGVNASGALASSQEGEASLNARSGMQLHLPGAATDSTSTISGNHNTALGVINDATNVLKVDGNGVDPSGSAARRARVNANNVAADVGLANRQLTSGSVDSTALTDIRNSDAGQASTTGLDYGSLTIKDNRTVSEASANRADNRLALNGAAAGTDAGLLNVQRSSAAVTSSSLSNANVALNGPAGPAAAPVLNHGNVSMSGNSNLALARGNAANNVLEVSAGSGRTASSTSADASFGPGSNAARVRADDAVLNQQRNSGAVTATASGSYAVALNGRAGGNEGVNAGTIGIGGNSVSAEAYGNSATNRLTVAASGSGAPSAAIGSYQQNSGPITATASSVHYGIGVAGAIRGGSLSVTGNQVGASAVGNSSTTSIAAR